MAPEIKPYKIAVPDKALELVKAKLESSTFFDEVDFSDNWDYGVPLSDVKRLAAHWKDGFNWREQEARINDTLPQFTTTVNVEGFGDLEMHFVHQKSGDPNSIPLLFSHGCKYHPHFTDVALGHARGELTLIKGLEVFWRWKRSSSDLQLLEMVPLSMLWPRHCPTLASRSECPRPDSESRSMLRPCTK